MWPRHREPPLLAELSAAFTEPAVVASPHPGRAGALT